jgi:hypothetical protein
MKPETCTICKGPVPTKGNCSLPIEWGGKNYYVCSPQCELNLGRRMGAELKNREPGDA